MDIAKYIGLYLLKNTFCYIHGLGNLELKKRPAQHDGQVLQGPVYEVTLSLTGSIDDSFANFIATHEQTSISKAANALRDFSIATRTDLAAGKDVEIPSLGRFTEQNGLIRFVTDPNLQYTPPAIPILRTSKRLEEAPSFGMKTPVDYGYSSTGRINWGKIGLWGAIVAVVVILIIFGIRSMNNSAGPPVDNMVPQSAQATATPENAQTDTTVSAAAAPPPAATAATAQADGKARVILGTYTSRGAAERRIKTLSSNGNTVELVAKDSTSFLVVMPIILNAADSARTMDSLRRMFNPKGVSVLR
jgi:nucleoid DNA-binding protein